MKTVTFDATLYQVERVTEVSPTVKFRIIAHPNDAFAYIEQQVSIFGKKIWLHIESFSSKKKAKAYLKALTELKGE